jgi:hypothetical protein
MIPRRLATAAAVVLAATLAAACRPDEAAHDDAPPAAAAAVSHDAPTPMVFDSALAAREPGALREVAAALVHGRVGPGERPFEVALRTPETRTGHARRFGTRTLNVQLRTRTPDLTQYPCTSCHMGRPQALADERIADAHAGLRVVHPAGTGATCATCHDRVDVERLALRSGERVSLDHAYRVCAQCHFRQAEAWAAGAHGKRLDGWQGRRIVMSCADCHDPHAPALVQRVPFQPPRLHRNGDREP